MFTNNKLSKAVRLAIAVGAASATAFTASVTAQEQGDTAKVERIEVTGSRIKRTDLESASPISVFSAEDIEAAGYPTLEKFVQSLPAVNGAAQGSNVNNGSNGSATVSLRGLGSGRTLVLINGRRTAFSDLNAIPMSFIERVEILRDGASTSYGSDAIAGVVNFITKRTFEGAEFVTQYDMTSEGDGETTKLAATIGTSTDKGNVVLALEYNNRNPIGQKDREYSRCPLADDGMGGAECFGSGTTAMGTWTSLEEGSIYKGYIVDPKTGLNRPLNPATDAYNFATTSYMVTPQEVFSINAAAGYELTDNTRAFLEGGFTNRQSDQLMGPEGTFWGQIVPADHPNNPIGERLVINRRLTETGGRAFTQDFSDYRMVVGFEGLLENGWEWDVAYNYTRFVDTRVDFGRANPKRFARLTDQAACDEDALCPGLWNPFSPNTLTPAQLDYAFLPNSPVVRGGTRQFMANLSGDLGDLELPAGRLQWAVGVEKRWEDYLFQPDGAALIGEIFSVAGEKTEGAYDVKEAYLEINAPLLADLPGADYLGFTAAIRSSKYSFLDSESTTKFGIEYKPFEGLLFRATRADGFRAPSISELFAPQQESNLAYNEPCTEYGLPGATQSAIVKANCAADGLPADFKLTSNQSSSLVGGNPELNPEESESLTVGVVYTPAFIENFSIALDYFDIEITNGIGTAGTSNIINGCYESANFSSSLCTLLIGAAEVDRIPYPTSPRRDVLGAMAGILVTNANLSTFETSGIDFDASYAFDLGSGRMKLRVDGTYLSEYKYTPFEGESPVKLAGFYGEDQWETSVAAFAEWRTNFTAAYSADNWSASWTARYMSGTDDETVADLATSTNTRNHAPSVVYHDVQGSYFIDQYTFTFGVRNLFNKLPVYTTNNADMNTISPSYDLAGTYLYGRVVVKF
jgi:iron complex outermembrane recepter protein